MLSRIKSIPWRALVNETWCLAKATSAGWSKYECTTQAAAISYYAALSLFPFVVVLISGVGLFFEFFESGHNAEKTVLDGLSEIFSPEMSTSVSSILKGVQNQARAGGPIAALVLLYLGSRVFAQIDKAFNHIWEVKSRRKRSLRVSAKQMLFNRLRSFAMLAGFGAIVILIFFGGTALYTIETFLKTWFPNGGSIWSLRTYFLSLGTNTLIFGGIYRFLSKGPVHWPLCFGTGLLVGCLWEIGRAILANLVIGENYTALGVVGSFLGILVWIFYNNLALLSGAILVRVIATQEPEKAMKAPKSPRRNRNKKR